MWYSNRGSCSFLFEMRGTDRYASANVCAASDADVLATCSATPTDPRDPMVRVGGVPRGHGPARHDLLAVIYNAHLWAPRLDVRWALPWGYAPGVDGQYVALACCNNDF